MNSRHIRTGKALISGADAVGSAFTYALAQVGLGDDIDLLDARHEMSVGQVRHERRKPIDKLEKNIRSMLSSEQ